MQDVIALLRRLKAKTREKCQSLWTVNYLKHVPLEWPAAPFFQAPPQNRSRRAFPREDEAGAAVAG